MKHYLYTLLALGVSFNAMADDPKIIVPDSTGFKFTDTKVIKTTRVEDQYKSAFATEDDIFA